MAETNPVYNPSFEYDANGASPAAWSSSVSGTFTLNLKEASEGWSSVGKKSCLLKATKGNNVTNSYLFFETTSAAVIPAKAGAKYAVRVDFNVIQAAGESVAVKFKWLNAAKAQIGETTNYVIEGGITGVHNVTTVSAEAAPAETAYLGIQIFVKSKTKSQVVELYVDAVDVAEGEVAPTYHDGDSTGWKWTGTAGNSPSEAEEGTKGELKGESLAKLLASAALGAIAKLAGSSEAKLLASGKMTAIGALKGASASTLAATGKISGSATGTLKGSSAVALSTSGKLTAIGALKGQSTTALLASGKISATTIGTLKGSSASTLAATGKLTGVGAFKGSTAIALLATGKISSSSVGTLKGESALKLTASGKLATLPAGYRASSSEGEVSEGSATLTLARPTGTQVGDLLLAILYTQTEKATTPEGWTEVAAAHATVLNDSGTVVGHIRAYQRTAAEGDPASWNFTLCGKFTAGGILALVGITVKAATATNSSNTNVLELTLPSQTASGEALLLVCTGTANGTTFATVEGMYEAFDVYSNAVSVEDVTLAVDVQAVSAGATGTRTMVNQNAGGLGAEEAGGFSMLLEAPASTLKGSASTAFIATAKITSSAVGTLKGSSALATTATGKLAAKAALSGQSTLVLTTSGKISSSSTGTLKGSSALKLLATSSIAGKATLTGALSSTHFAASGKIIAPGGIPVLTPPTRLVVTPYEGVANVTNREASLVLVVDGSTADVTPKSSKLALRNYGE